MTAAAAERAGGGGGMLAGGANRVRLRCSGSVQLARLQQRDTDISCVPNPILPSVYFSAAHAGARGTLNSTGSVVPKRTLPFCT